MQTIDRKVDLDELAKRLKLRVEISSTDDPLEGAFQRQQKEADSRLQRIKDAVLFVIAVLLVMIMSSICFWIALGSRFNVEDKKWATSILTLIIGGIIGYLTGKAVK